MCKQTCFCQQVSLKCPHWRSTKFLPLSASNWVCRPKSSDLLSSIPKKFAPYLSGAVSPRSLSQARIRAWTFLPIGSYNSRLSISFCVLVSTKRWRNLTESPSSRLDNVLKQPDILRELQKLMPKNTYRDCLATPVNLKGVKIPSTWSVSTDPANTLRNKQSPSSIGDDPGLRYTTATEILEPPVVLMDSRRY